MRWEYQKQVPVAIKVGFTIVLDSTVINYYDGATRKNINVSFEIELMALIMILLIIWIAVRKQKSLIH